MNVSDVELTIEYAPAETLQGGSGTVPAGTFVDVTVQAKVTVNTPFRKAFLFVDLYADDTDEAPPSLSWVLPLRDPMVLFAGGPHTVKATRRLPRWKLDEDPGLQGRRVTILSRAGIDGQIVTPIYNEDEFRARILLTTGLSPFAVRHIAWSDKAVAPSQTASFPTGLSTPEP